MSFYLNKNQFREFFDVEKNREPWIDYILNQNEFRLEISLLNIEEWVGIVLWKDNQQEWVFDAYLNHVEKINFEKLDNELLLQIYVYDKDEPMINIRIQPTIKISLSYK